MPKRRKSKGIAARIGTLLGRKPKRVSVPHVYVTTESERVERRAKAKARAAKAKAQKAAAAPAAVKEVTKGAGKILNIPKTDAAFAQKEDANALKNEAGFMQKVQLQRANTTPRKGIGFWTLVRDRVAPRAPSRTRPSTENIKDIDLSSDAFLKHATSTSPTDEKNVPREAPSALDEVATSGRIVMPTRSEPKAAAPIMQQTEGQKSETERARKENADIVEVQKPTPAPTTKPEPAPVKKKLSAPQFQSKKGLKSFFTSLNYIGMGKERFLFVQNMATMLNAGLPLVDSLHTLVLETRNRSMRKLIQRIIEMVENGSPLWRAMEAQSFFSLHALALVRIGEEAGNLAENMGYLAVQDEKDHALRSKVKMAMIYPTIVLVIMFIIIIGLGTFVLPNLIGVLFSLNVDLPLVTRLVIMFSNAFTEYGAVGVPSFVGGFVLLLILSKYTALRVVTQWVMFKVPGIGRLAREATIARFGVILGGLLKAGVPVVEALQSLVQVTPIAAYKKLYAQMLGRVTIGDSFSKCFASIRGCHKLLPASVQQLVITGEKSGSLADIMLKIADIYDKKASETAEKLPVILEPMLLLFIGGLVGTIAFAIIIPIYSIVGNVGG